MSSRDTTNKTEIFFTQFLREFRMGLRSEDQPFVDQLIQELIAISLIIPPSNPDHQYSFREILMLIALINQRKIHKIKSNLFF